MLRIQEARTSLARAIAEAAAARWDGLTADQFTPATEVCTGWGDFRDSTYERGQMAFAWGVRLGSKSRDVFNGVMTTTAYPAFRNGVAVVFTQDSFSPNSGHANYGHGRFIPVGEFEEQVKRGEWN